MAIPGLLPVRAGNLQPPVLPTTNLTLRFDASDVGNVFQSRIAANPCWSTPCTDNTEAQVWKSTIPAPNSEVVFSTNGSPPAAGPNPTWKSSSPALALPDLLFDGSNDQVRVCIRNGGSTVSNLSNYMSTTAGTILAAFQIHSSTHNSSPDQNDVLAVEAGKTCGMAVRKATSGPDTYKLQFYNQDSGGYDTIELSVLLNTDYVACWRHDATNLYASLNGAPETSLASGTTVGLGAPLLIGGDGARFLGYSLGEILVYNTALTGSDLANAINYLTAKWF